MRERNLCAIILSVVCAVLLIGDTARACDPKAKKRRSGRQSKVVTFKVSAAQTDQGSWVRLAPAGQARQEVGVAELDGKIYLIGGILAGDTANTVEAYDPKTDRWSFLAPLPEPLHHSTAVGLSGRLYVVGGYNTLSFNPVNSAYRYDPVSNSWTAIADYPTRRGALSLVAIGNRIYAVGGAGGGITNELNVYDPATDTWTQRAPMTENSMWQAGATEAASRSERSKSTIRRPIRGALSLRCLRGEAESPLQ
jgi:hypothetical protein